MAVKYGIIKITNQRNGCSFDDVLIETAWKQMKKERNTARKFGAIQAIKDIWINWNPKDNTEGIAAFNSSAWLQSSMVTETDKTTAEAIFDSYEAVRAQKIRIVL